MGKTFRQTYFKRSCVSITYNSSNIKIILILKLAPNVGLIIHPLFFNSKELKVLKKSSYVRGVYMTFNLFNTRFAMFATMISLSLLGEPLAADKVSIPIYFPLDF